MSAYGDELQAQIKHAVEQQTNNYRTTVFGHIASWDPKTSRARAVIPSHTDDGQNYVLTPWFPLHTGFNGSGWGIQAGPVGGATQQNPTQGELVLIHLGERHYGSILGGQLIANQALPPPNAALKAGEIYLKGKGGQSFYLKQNGDIVINTPTQETVTATSSITLTVGGVTLKISSAGVAITGGQVTHNGKDIGSDHVHTGVTPGASNTGPPA